MAFYLKAYENIRLMLKQKRKCMKPIKPLGIILIVGILTTVQFIGACAKTDFIAQECIRFAKRAFAREGEAIQKAFFVPQDEVKKILLGLIHNEREEIKAALFRLTDKDIAHALLAAHERGIKITLITDQGCLYDRYEKIRLLMKHGVPVYVFGDRFNTIMHNKFFIFKKNLQQRPLLWTGSVNATVYGTTKNRENVVVSNNAALINQYEQQFATLQKEIGAPAAHNRSSYTQDLALYVYKELNKLFGYFKRAQER